MGSKKKNAFDSCLESMKKCFHSALTMSYCTKAIEFKIYFIIFGIADLIYGILVSLNCISKWNNTGITDYVSLGVVSVSIAIIVFLIVVRILQIICLFYLSRTSLIIYLIFNAVLTCISFSAVWISYIDKIGILNDLSKVYSGFNSQVDIESFESKFKCCGWEFISSRCTSKSGVSCTIAIGSIIEQTGNSTGNTLIPLVIIQLSESLFVIFILVCYSGVDWREIKPFIRSHSREEDL